MKNVLTAAAIIITAAMMLNAQTDTIVLQQGFNGYTGCRDKEIRDSTRNRFKPQVEHLFMVSEFCPDCPFARAAIRFDLGTLPEKNGEIINATLALFVGAYGGGSMTGGYYALYQITRNWVDDEANWINATKDTPWTTPGGDYLSEKIVEITRSYENDNFGWMNLNVLETVKYFIANPDKNFGFLLRNTKLAQEIDIATSEFDFDSTYRPKLMIEYPAGTVHRSQKQVRLNPRRSPVKLSAINHKLHIANNGTAPVAFTLSRLDGTTVASEMLPGGMSEILSPRNAGVYLLSVSGNNFTVHENVSFFH